MRRGSPEVRGGRATASASESAGSDHLATVTGPKAGEQPDDALAARGQQRIAWADRSMPVLRAIRERFEVEKPLGGLRVAACLHVTAESANLLRTLVAGGAELALVASDAATTQPDVAASLLRDHQIPIHATRGDSPERPAHHLIPALGHRPQLLLEDGADLAAAICRITSGRLGEVDSEVRAWAETLPAEDRARLAAGVVAGLEVTTAGVDRLRAFQHDGDLGLPVVAANDAPTRHVFDNLHGNGQSTIDGILRASDMLMSGARVVVLGYGWAGRGIAIRARGLGARVIIAEIDPVRALGAALDGFDVMEMSRAAGLGHLFISATGVAGSIRCEHFLAMRDGAVACNASLSGAGLDLDELAGSASVVNRGVREFIDEYVLPDGRRVNVLGAGRPINLVAANGHPASIMDLSFAAQALAAEWAVGKRGQLEPKVYHLPAAIDRWVATLKLQSMGITFDIPAESGGPAT